MATASEAIHLQRSPSLHQLRSIERPPRWDSLTRMWTSVLGRGYGEDFMCKIYHLRPPVEASGQYYKASTIVIYESRVVNLSNILVITTQQL